MTALLGSAVFLYWMFTAGARINFSESHVSENFSFFKQFSVTEIHVSCDEVL